MERPKLTTNCKTTNEILYFYFGNQSRLGLCVIVAKFSRVGSFETQSIVGRPESLDQAVTMVGLSIQTSVLRQSKSSSGPFQKMQTIARLTGSAIHMQLQLSELQHSANIAIPARTWPALTRDKLFPLLSVPTPSVNTRQKLVSPPVSRSENRAMFERKPGGREREE